MRKENAIFLLLFFIPILSFSGIQRYERNIRWTGIHQLIIAENEYIPVLRFDESKIDYNHDYLPLYFERIQLTDGNVDLSAIITNEIYEPLSQEEVYAIDGNEYISSEIKISSGIAYDRKIPYATVSFIPIRKNELTGFYERLLFFELEIKTTASIMANLKTRSYKDNSVLAEGNWYKISVNKTGIHKISYQNLIDLGMDVNNLDPKNIRLYGYGRGMVAENNNEFRYDDLPENAIYVAGEGDGSFDSGDYILFYGESPDVWEYDDYMYKKIHLYSDYTYYFLTSDLDEGKRIQSQPSSTLDPTFYSDKFNDGFHYELEENNLIGTGRIWYGETFDQTTELLMDVNFPYLDVDSPVFLVADVAARYGEPTSFSFKINNTNQLTLVVPLTNSAVLNSDYAKTKFGTTSFSASGSDLNIKVTYNKDVNTSAVGYLNYFILNVTRDLSFSGSQMNFRDLRTAQQEHITEYSMSKITSNLTIWNVSDPTNVKEIETTTSNSKLIFKVQSDKLEEFVAFNGSSYYSVNLNGAVTNQNLHGLGEYDMMIITHDNFTDEAIRLANHHTDFDGMNVIVCELQTIYNEFSSGSQDISAIRDFVKMLYDKASAGNEPKYLLLFGDGSYDMKDRVENNTNYIPTWTSQESLNPVNSYTKDDFYGNLDGDNMVDIGIGRFVVTSSSQARDAVDKVIHYATNSDEVMGDWRNVVCLIADDEDNGLHFQQAEEHAYNIDTTTCNINVDKIYLDAYEQVSGPSGEKYPKVTDDINKRINRGALFMNYIGHGGELGLAHERIVTITDINSWDNFDNMPVFITATCEFSRFDDPERTSAGEHVFLNPKGGGISLFTTSRATYAGANFKLNKYIYKFALQEVEGKHLRMGDVIRLAKNESGNDVNTNKFVLLGDPALEFAFPKQEVITTKINGISVYDNFDTIKALSEVTITGELEDYFGNKLTDFNGLLYPTVFDKPTKYTTLGNDPSSPVATFRIQKNPLFKGKASIENGEWEFTFVVPKDIAYEYNFGKLSYYAKREGEDASGCFTDVIVGGYNEEAGINMEGPVIELFMCNEFFKDGGTTDEDPEMIAYIQDDSGINTVGSGIGHNITATLDDSQEFILNDYYESDLDKYTSGTIRYPFFNLRDGRHTLTLKVWDIYNNPSTAQISFVVNGESDGLNFPNPFRTTTQFTFEHTYCEEEIDVDIRIYSLTGQMVKRIRDKYISDCYEYVSEPWDGTNDAGGKLAGGIYIYKIFVNNSVGESVLNLSNKLILVD